MFLKRFIALFFVLVVFAIAIPAQAISTVCEAVKITVVDPSRAIESAKWVTKAHRGCHPKPKPEVVVVEPAPAPHYENGVEQWRDLVSSYFGDETNLAMCVMRGESNGNPNAYNPSGASGLFQIMPHWADYFGVSTDALFDPTTNVVLAHKIRNIQGWGAWNAYYRC